MLTSYRHLAQRLCFGTTISLLPTNEELTDLYFSPNIISVIKSGRMRWPMHVARIGTGEVHTEFWWGNPRDKDHLEDRGVDGRTIVIRIFKKWVGAVNRIDLVLNKVRWRLVEPSGSIKLGNFLTSCEHFSFSRNILLHGVSYIVT
jgi:hypothetical protein